MVLPAHPAAQAAGVSELLEPLLLFLGLSEERGIILAIDRDKYPHLVPLRPLVQALLLSYPDLVVTHDPAALTTVPRGAVVLLCLQDETLTQDGRWLDLHRQLVDDRALRVVIWCAGFISQRLAQAAPHFSDWIAHYLVLPTALLQPPAHAVLGLRALVRARIPGAQFSESQSDLEYIVQTALPRWRVEDVGRWSYPSLLRVMQRYGGPRLLRLDIGSERDQRRLLWAIAESRWRRPCLIYESSLRPLGWWALHDRYMPLAQAIGALSAAPQPGALAVLLGLEPEAIDLCARLLALGADARALSTELISAADPGAAIALRLASLGQIDLEQVARGEADPPTLRALGSHPQVRSRRSVLRGPGLYGDPDEALRYGDIAVALHWIKGATGADSRRVEQAARALVSQRAGVPIGRGGNARLCLLHAPIDEPKAAELAQLLRLLPGVSEVDLNTDECTYDMVLPLLSADFFAYDPAYDALKLVRSSKQVMIPILLRPCSWQDVPELDGLQMLPDPHRAVSRWDDPDAAWTVILRGVAALLKPDP